MVNQYYGLKLQELCEAKEITKNEIIKKTGIPKSSLSRFFSGEGYLNLDQIACRTSVEALMFSDALYDWRVH